MSIIAADVHQRSQRAADALPLIHELLAMLMKRYCQRLRKNGCGRMHPVAKRDANGEFMAFAEVNFADHSHVTVFCPVKLPIHGEIVIQVLPTVAESGKTT